MVDLISSESIAGGDGITGDVNFSVGGFALNMYERLVSSDCEVYDGGDQLIY